MLKPVPSDLTICDDVKSKSKRCIRQPQGTRLINHDGQPANISQYVYTIWIQYAYMLDPSLYAREMSAFHTPDKRITTFNTIWSPILHASYDYIYKW